MFKWWSGLKSRIAKLELKFAKARQLEWTNASDKGNKYIATLHSIDIQLNWTNGFELIE